MTPTEFRAWLERFEASFNGGVPNATQWMIIRDKLAELSSVRIDGGPHVPVPYPHTSVMPAINDARSDCRFTIPQTAQALPLEPN